MFDFKKYSAFKNLFINKLMISCTHVKTCVPHIMTFFAKILFVKIVSI
jgi:hypothetical protein